MEAKTKILITGATGFLGSCLVKTLLEKGYEVAAIKRSTSDLFRLKGVEHQVSFYNVDELSVEDCLEKIKPHIIIHCATDYGRKNVEPSSIIEANLILPLKLLEGCLKHKVKCFINTDTYLDKGINYYSLSKKQFNEWLNTYSAELICVNIILEHFYGPFDDKTKFVSFITGQFLQNSTEINLTLGEQKRDFIYVDDVVSAFTRVLESLGKMSNGMYNFGIGTNQQIKIKDLVVLIKTLTKNTETKTNFGAIAYRPNEIMNSDIDTRAIRELGWKPEYSIEEGLKKMITLEK